MSQQNENHFSVAATSTHSARPVRTHRDKFFVCVCAPVMSQPFGALRRQMPVELAASNKLILTTSKEEEE